MSKTSPRRAMFPKEYVVDFNATKAAERCGYSKKTARSQGQRLLTKVDIQQAVKGLVDKRGERLEITADKWLRELAIIGFSDIKNHINIDDYGCIVAKTFEEMPENSSRALEVCEEVRTIKETPGDEKHKGETTILNSRIKFKMHSKIAALELIGKHLGFLKDQPVAFPENVTFRFVYADEKPKAKG
ncbi:MAG: terminase small subunit [Candidatus Aminicenantales bacterium]